MKSARHTMRVPLFAGLVMIIVTLACSCGQIPGGVTFSPPDGSTIYVDETISITATDNQCATNENVCGRDHTLKASGACLDSATSTTRRAVTGPTATLDSITPGCEGDMTVTFEREDTVFGVGNSKRGTATYHVVVRPAEDAVRAEGDDQAQGPQATCGNGTLETGEACEPGGDQCGPNQTCNTATCQCESTGTVTASASSNSGLIIRANPGPGCGEVEVNTDTTLVLDARSNDQPPWYHVQNVGWVFSGALEGWTFQPDPDTLPVDSSAVGCLYCGDGVCSASIDEAANTCEADCPAVCGDSYVTHAEACDPPESEPGDPAYGEAAVSWCNDSCQVSTKEPPAEPPFDTSACGAACSDDPDCPSGFTCVDPGFCTHPSCP